MTHFILYTKKKLQKWVNLRMKHRMVMARVDLRDELHEQVLKTVAGGSLSLEDIFLIKMVLIIQPLSLLIYNRNGRF
jgi:hypothetical protein